MPPKPKLAGTSPPATVSADLGLRLREGRERKGFTVRGLARYVGVSPSLVSQVERGRVMPSVGTLYAIANQLDLVVDDLFRDANAPRAERVRAAADAYDPVQRARNRKTIRLAEGVRWERLTPLPDPEVEFLYVVYEVGAESCDKDSLIRHGGKEYAVMIGGRLGLTIGFEEFELGPGDSITFDAQMPHRLWTIGKKPAEAIWVVYNRHGDTRQPGSKSESRRSTWPRAGRSGT
jgi:transcriptional regulator with XRE-family HTH domain